MRKRLAAIILSLSMLVFILAPASAFANHRNSEGEQSVSKKQAAIMIGGGTLAGAAIGAIAGGKKGAGIGALIGGGAGTVMVLTKKPKSIIHRLPR